MMDNMPIPEEMVFYFIIPFSAHYILDSPG